MLTVNDNLHESLPATPESVPLLRNRVTERAARAGIRGERLDDVRLAVSEAVTNVVVHAYPQEPGLIHVSARAVDGEFWVIIADDGCGHNTASKTPGLGWGLAVITRVCDEFTLIERSQGGTEARLNFRIRD